MCIGPLFYVILLDTLVVGFGIVFGFLDGHPRKYFGEHEAVTYFSSLQLLAISWLAFKILRIRNVRRKQLHWHSNSLVWGIIALGFLFLAVDDFCLIHEGIDKRIHYAFGIKETALTDHIDDILIAIYALLGIAVLYMYRNEVKKYKQTYPFFICGFVLLFLMVACDMLNARMDILSMLLESDIVHPVHLVLSIVEDPLKVFSEGFFLVGFYSAFQISKLMDERPVGSTTGNIGAASDA